MSSVDLGHGGLAGGVEVVDEALAGLGAFGADGRELLDEGVVGGAEQRFGLLEALQLCEGLAQHAAGSRGLEVVGAKAEEVDVEGFEQERLGGGRVAGPQLEAAEGKEVGGEVGVILARKLTFDVNGGAEEGSGAVGGCVGDGGAEAAEGPGVVGVSIAARSADLINGFLEALDRIDPTLVLVDAGEVDFAQGGTRVVGAEGGAEKIEGFEVGFFRCVEFTGIAEQLALALEGAGKASRRRAAAAAELGD